MGRIRPPDPTAAQDRAVAATLCVLVLLQCLTLIASLLWL
ncbi:hypothetical protein Y590_14230 [Methylobacterium sp. AMS5]|nr:hypothetical protein Y590_14230 [Methylobacterium sp. AMS5]